MDEAADNGVNEADEAAADAAADDGVDEGDRGRKTRTTQGTAKGTSSTTRTTGPEDNADTDEKELTKRSSFTASRNIA